jgi:hypothetical protein
MERKEYMVVGSSLVEKVKPEPHEQKTNLPEQVLPEPVNEELEVKEQGDVSH